MAVFQYFTRNNQPKTRGGGVRRGDETIVLGGIKSWEEIKN